MKKLIEKIKRITDLSADAEQILLSLAKEKVVPKGQALIEEGQLVKKQYFVTDGCLRSFCTDKNGKEHTLQFAIKNWWISDYMAINNDDTATLTVECLKDSVVIEFETAALNAMREKFRAYDSFQRHILERHVSSLHLRILNQLRLSAAERYDLFLKQYPDIEQYTRNYHIASYLGITTESLSRIRKELSSP